MSAATQIARDLASTNAATALLDTLPTDEIRAITGAKSTGDYDENWMDDMELNPQEAAEIAEPSFVYRDLIIQSHVIALVGEPGAGKTTIALHVAGLIAREGYKVFYVNADTNGADAKRMIADANKMGYRLLTPDLKGSSMDVVVDNLKKMRDSGKTFENQVWFFDTIKKMTDVISKQRAKDLLKLTRALSAKGMTVVLLGHTNKYADQDGRPVYEGTGDLKSDIDEMIYLIPSKPPRDRQPGETITVSTDLEKVRGALRKITFEIDGSMNVRQLDGYQSTTIARQIDAQRGKDSGTIHAICEAVNSGMVSQQEIIEYCREDGIGRDKVINTLKRYSEGNDDGQKPSWTRIKDRENNMWNHGLIS